jgi:DNA-binding response OmpR family regulator
MGQRSRPDADGDEAALHSHAHAGQTVTADFILRRLWPMETAYEDRLRVYVHRLRRKIEQQPDQPKYILSQRGVGYSSRRN